MKTIVRGVTLFPKQTRQLSLNMSMWYMMNSSKVPITNVDGHQSADQLYKAVHSMDATTSNVLHQTCWRMMAERNLKGWMLLVLLLLMNTVVVPHLSLFHFPRPKRIEIG